MDPTSENVCLVCNDELPADDKMMTCVECEYSYHLGACSGIAESTFKSKTDISRKSWRCPTCRIAKTKSGQSVKGKKEPEFSSILVEINKKLSCLVELKDTVSEIEASIKMMSEKYDKLLESTNRHDKEITNMKKKLELLEKNETQSELNQLRQTVNDLEWRDRRLNLEIHGIPQSDGENLMSIINDVATKLNVPALGGSDISALHRLPARPDKLPGIIVRFAQQSIRDKWWESRRVLRRGNGDSRRDMLFIQENLTKQNRALLWTTKEWARNKDYRFVWHSGGKILVRKKEGERAIVVKCEADLRRLE